MTRRPSKAATDGRGVDAGAPPFAIVAIGASAGGMEAFTELLRELPADPGMAFVLIQHLDPTHPSYLSEALGRATPLPVVEIEDGMAVAPDHVYVLPSHADAGILRGTLQLVARSSAPGRPHLPIDFFFRALAADQGTRAIGVVLSGTGSDGAEGTRAIKAEGGVTFAQAPASARFGGMPEAAIRTGAVDFTLTIAELARELVRVGQHPFVRGPDQEVLGGPADATELKKVLMLVRSAAGVDFSEYKLTSIRRRLARRMALHRIATLREYTQRLRDDRAEARALVEDLLINVTSFFRDREVYDRLEASVFPELLEHKRGGGAIRIWSAGCSTGEEAYSLMIALLDFLDREGARDTPLQLFGTDISERAIEHARAGCYSDEATRPVGAERLARYFTRLEGGGYRIGKAVRERCAFVRHDLARDPPFSRLDLVSCRNVLIYFGPTLQQRVLAAFHFALAQPGFLLLGHAETIGEGAGGGLFTPIDKEHRIFARTAARSALRLLPPRDAPAVPLASPPSPRPAPAAAEIIRRAESRLLDAYAPPGVIVNERMEILHFRGRTGPYLEPAPGQPQHDLLKMAKKGLMSEIRVAIAQAAREDATVRRPGVLVAPDPGGAPRSCDIVVVPIGGPPEHRERVFAVLFEDAAAPRPRAAAPAPAPEPGPTPGPAPGPGDPRLATLEGELEAAKAYLQSIIDEHQRTNEELVSANEELLSSNEELQSLNEELETAKEELQSTNEELSTLNEEMRARNTELDSVNSDLLNILGSVEVPIVIVDGARRIRRFTPRARPILNLLPGDVGRPIDDIRPTLEIDGLHRKIAEVIETVVPHEEEVRGPEGRWFRLQIKPYTTVDKKIDGAVLSVVDIDMLKRAIGAAEWARDYAKATVEALPVPIVVLDETMTIVSLNAAFEERYGVARSDASGRRLDALFGDAWDTGPVRAALDGLLARHEPFQQLELACELPGLGRRALSMSGRAIPAPGAARAILLLAVDDVTARRRAEAEREHLLEEARRARASAEDANRTKDVFLATLSHELRTPLSALLLQAQLLGQGGLDAAQARRAAATIERAARAQAQLVDDLLDVSRIVAGKLKMELRPVQLAEVVRAAAETVVDAAADKGLALELRLDEAVPAVAGDPVRLQQVVWNLLTNAVKFTPGGGRITVTVDAEAGRGRIRVADTGIGVEPSFLPHLFEQFTQEDRGPTRSRGGLGLGLAIVRYVVEAHGGTIEADSAGRGRGATFTVRLPLMPARAAEAPPGELAAGDDRGATIAGARVLVVEDDADTREAIAAMLARAGAGVRTAASPAEAIASFEADPPELLVCDIAMPDEDGYGLLRRIRARGPAGGGDVPAIALTALASEDDRRRAAEAGFQLHLAKPIDIDRLVAALAALRRPPAPT